MALDRTLANRLMALAIFAGLGLYLSSVVPSVEVAWVMAILLLTIYLFAFEIVSVDVAAITIMVLLGLSDLLAPLMGLERGLVSTRNLFDGFASNAVISIIAVMIIGAGLDKTGLMSRLASFILRIGGTTEKRIIPLISGTVGIISSFMQNVGAAALFIPVVSRISARSGLPMSRLLMPMGFCAILGGTVTMIGSSPLILLNDLILTSNQSLPEHQQMRTFDLFDVTPIGLALVTTGIIYFVLAGRMVLPVSQGKRSTGRAAVDYFAETYGLHGFQAYEVRVTADSPLAGMSVDDIEARANHRLRVVAVDKGDGLRIGADGVDRQIAIEAGTMLGVLTFERFFGPFAEQNHLTINRDLRLFADALAPSRAGIAEVLIPPSSDLIGKSARDLWLRKKYGLSLLAIHRGDKVINCMEGGDVRNEPFGPGDLLVVHTTWDDLARLEQDRDFVVVTTEYPHEELRPHKVVHALIFFVATLGLVLFTDLMLSVKLLFGALGMILAGVLTIDEAYEAVSWKTVFLLASLIPLGLAVETSGAAAWIADQTLQVVGHMPIWVIQASIAILATFFTLVMSNVGATVLLVPLVVNIAIGVDANPAVFALIVGVATSNSFILPTHQVNALTMGPGGYRVPDFMRAGGVMTILFLIVMIAMMNLVF
jgi:di/tricarboxylate transporter